MFWENMKGSDDNVISDSRETQILISSTEQRKPEQLA